MLHDPIVEEVRAIRDQLAAQFDYDIQLIVQDAQRKQAASQRRIVSFERAPAVVPSELSSIVSDLVPQATH